MRNVIKVEVLRSEQVVLVDPEQFKRLIADPRKRVLSTEIVPPRLGKKGFGKLRVRVRSVHGRP